MFGIKPKTLHYWYKEHLSSYRQALATGRWGNKKIGVADQATAEEVKERPVHIAKPENFGSHFTIDEIQIGKIMYTIMTNSKTGKIAFLAQTLKPEELKLAFDIYLSQVLDMVNSVSRDMSQSYIKFCKDIFPNLQLVTDKFHVIRHLMNALQMVRKQLKTKCLLKQKEITQKDKDKSGEKIE